MILAGEPERQARIQRKEGIEIDQATWLELRASALKVNAVGLFEEQG
jgi:LDH2 family malate/lactate/ureidoglycolate dehydrogenase